MGYTQLDEQVNPGLSKASVRRARMKERMRQKMKKKRKAAKLAAEGERDESGDGEEEDVEADEAPAEDIQSSRGDLHEGT